MNITDLKRLDAEATAAPWIRCGRYVNPHRGDEITDPVVEARGEWGTAVKANALLAAVSRTLLAETIALVESVGAFRAACDNERITQDEVEYLDTKVEEALAAFNAKLASIGPNG